MSSQEIEDTIIKSFKGRILRTEDTGDNRHTYVFITNLETRECIFITGWMRDLINNLTSRVGCKSNRTA